MKYYIIITGLLLSKLTSASEVLPEVFNKVAEQENVPSKVLKAICWVESKHKNGSVNYFDGKSHSLGLCQVKLETARWLGYKGTEQELQFNPIINITYAAKYLSYQLERYNNMIDYAIAAYNSGSLIQNKYNKIVNRKYVEKVKEAMIRF